MAEITVEKIKRAPRADRSGDDGLQKGPYGSRGRHGKSYRLPKEEGLGSSRQEGIRAAEQGLVESYLHHNGKIGVLLELKCESDFVARTDVFRELAKEIAMHIAWAKPDYVSKEDVPREIVEREEAVEKERARTEGKPEAVLDKIIVGRMAKFYERVCLLEQPFIRDDSKKVGNVIAEKVAVLGENIVVGRFARLALGE